MRMSAAALSLAAGVLLAQSARGAEFPAGHLLYTSPADDFVVELDAAGAVQTSFGPGLSLDEPVDAAFGPDGLLYVASRANDKVVKIGTGGTAQGVISGSGLTRPNALAFGPRGNLLVASEDQDVVYEFGPTGALVRKIGLGSGLDRPAGVAVGSDGRIYVASGDTDEVFVFDIEGAQLETVGGSGVLDSPCRVDFDPAGRLAVVSQGTGQVVIFGTDGQVEETLGGALNGAVEGAIGPDGRLYVSEAGAARIARFEPDGSAATPITGLPGSPSGFAIVPRRFQVRIAGSVRRIGVGVIKVKEDATLSLRPGSGTLALELVDKPDDDLDLFGLFGARFLVFSGFEAVAPNGARSVSGLELPALAQRDGSGSILLAVSGSVDGGGNFVPKKASGSLHRAREGRAFSGSVATKKALN